MKDDPYRVYPDQPKTYSRFYVVWSTFKKLITDAWKWWTWEQVIHLSIFSFIFLASLLFVTSVYYTMFTPHNITGCYIEDKFLKDNERGIAIVQSVEWRDDPTIKICKGDDILKCAKEVMDSDLCKPYSY